MECNILYLEIEDHFYCITGHRNPCSLSSITAVVVVVVVVAGYGKVVTIQPDL